MHLQPGACLRDNGIGSHGWCTARNKPAIPTRAWWLRAARAMSVSMYSIVLNQAVVAHDHRHTSSCIISPKAPSASGNTRPVTPIPSLQWPLWLQLRSTGLSCPPSSPCSPWDYITDGPWPASSQPLRYQDQQVTAPSSRNQTEFTDLMVCNSGKYYYNIIYINMIEINA